MSLCGIVREVLTIHNMSVNGLQCHTFPMSAQQLVFVLACLECAIDLGMVLTRRKTQLSVETNLLVVCVIVSALGEIFMWICRHGICYALYMLPNAECRNEALSFLLKHFKVAPKVIATVYNFACALQNYCLNRQPECVKNTNFVADRFHWFNQVSCARSYQLSAYLQYSYLNSQIAEQCNSALTRVKCGVYIRKYVLRKSNEADHIHV